LPRTGSVLFGLFSPFFPTVWAPGSGLTGPLLVNPCQVSLCRSIVPLRVNVFRSQGRPCSPFLSPLPARIFGTHTPGHPLREITLLPVPRTPAVALFDCTGPGPLIVSPPRCTDIRPCPLPRLDRFPLPGCPFTRVDDHFQRGPLVDTLGQWFFYVRRSISRPRPTPQRCSLPNSVFQPGLFFGS